MSTDESRMSTLDKLAAQFGGVALPGRLRIPQALLGIWTSPCHGDSLAARALWTVKCGLGSYTVYTAWQAESGAAPRVQQGMDPFFTWRADQGFESPEVDYDILALVVDQVQRLPRTTVRVENSDFHGVLIQVDAGNAALFYGSTETQSRVLDPHTLSVRDLDAFLAGVGDDLWRRWDRAGHGDMHVLLKRGRLGEDAIHLAPLPAISDFVDIGGVDALQLAGRLRRFLEAGLNRRLLLVGPPGTGKTSLVRRIVQLLGHGRLVQVSLDAARRLEAGGINDLIRMLRPRVLLLDDIDRGGHATSALLHTLDRIGCLVFATANLTEPLDAALLRPGRFDEVVNVGLPAEPARRAILAYYLDRFGLSLEPDARESLLERTEGLTPAEIRELVQCIAVLGPEHLDAEAERIRAQKQLYAPEQLRASLHVAGSTASADPDEDGS